MTNERSVHDPCQMTFRDACFHGRKSPGVFLSSSCVQSCDFDTRRLTVASFFFVFASPLDKRIK